MPTYRLIFFHSNRLERWEEFEADNFVAAVQMGAERAGETLVELWSEDRRIATYRPRRQHGDMGPM